MKYKTKYYKKLCQYIKFPVFLFIFKDLCHQNWEKKVVLSNNCLSRPYYFKVFKGCLPQILLCPFLNTLSQIFTKVASLSCGLTSSETFLKQTIFKRAASSLTFAVNYLIVIFHKIWLQFSVTLFSVLTSLL